MLKSHNAVPGKDTPETLNETRPAEIKGLLGSNPSFYCCLKISYTAHLPKKTQESADTELNRVQFLQYTNFKCEVELATGKAKHTSSHHFSFYQMSVSFIRQA